MDNQNPYQQNPQMPTAGYPQGAAPANPQAMAPAGNPAMPQPSMPNVAPSPATMVAAQRILAEKQQHEDKSSLSKTIAIIILSLTTATFIGLFVWIFIRYQEVSTDVNSQIDVAVAKAEDELTDKLTAAFAEEKKNPFTTFTGPEDYGAISFQFPKTWSVYIEKDASSGGDFAAYFSPNQVSSTSGSNSIYGLVAMIVNQSFDSVISSYNDWVSNGYVTSSAVTYNGINGTMFTGTFGKSGRQGMIFIFKIRDKTAILRTDSMLYENDYKAILNSLSFNA